MIFIAGEKFIDSGKILSLLIWAIFATTYGMVFGHINLAIDKQKKALGAYIAAAIVGLIGYFIFIPLYGVWGAVYVTIASESLATTILIILAIYYSKTRPYFRAFVKTIISCLIMSLVVYQFRTLPVLLNIAIGGIVYTLVSLALKTISPTTLKEVFSKS